MRPIDMKLAVGLCVALALTSAVRADTFTNITKGSAWHYFDGNAEPATNWMSLAYSDAGWSNGPALLGYGDPDIVTTIGFGPNPDDKYRTSYYRRDFAVSNAGELAWAQLRLLRDDGAIVYINGTEVYRNNMPTGSVTFSTYSSGSGSNDELTFFEQVFSPALLFDGVNVAAVEVHQHKPDTSDSRFDFALVTATEVPLPEVTRGPYLQVGTPTNMTVRWRTNIPADGRVRYGNLPGNLTSTAYGATNTAEHIVTLTNLLPYTRYYYALGAAGGDLVGDDTNHWFVTSPVPGWEGPTRIWAIGDSGTANAAARAVWEAYRDYASGRLTDVWLMLGDNAYPNGTDAEYQAAVFDMYPDLLRNTVVWPTLGNHETYNGETFSSLEQGPYYDMFSLPRAAEAGGLVSGTEAYYSFDYGNIHFVCMNSMDIDRAIAGLMMSWLTNDLARTEQEWIIAYWHHPPYTKGTHDSDNVNDGESRQMQDMRENALPILESHGADLVLSGHSHVYERSYLLNGHYGFSGSLDTNTMVIDHGDGREDGDGLYATSGGTGTVYAVCGCSGALGGGSLNHPAMHISMSRRGSMVIDVQGDRLDGLFLDSTGATMDHFSIQHVDPNETDTDTDGLPDWWELWYFGDLDEDADSDPDDDGSPNGEELGSGTHPNSDASSLRIEHVHHDHAADEMSFSWGAGYGWAYSVESATNLAPPVEWVVTDLSNRAAVANAPMSYTNAGLPSNAFFRVTVTPALP